MFCTRSNGRIWGPRGAGKRGSVDRNPRTVWDEGVIKQAAAGTAETGAKTASQRIYSKPISLNCISGQAYGV